MPDLAGPDNAGPAGPFRLFSSARSRESGRTGATPLAAASVADTVVIPGAALLLIGIAVYAGMVSFAIRPNIGARMLPIGLSFSLGIVLGGAAFPRLLEWARRGGGMRRAALVAWLAAPAAAVLPGTEQYIFNEPLRYLANLSLGMALAPAYHLFFSRFPVAWRGTCYGVCQGLCVLCWSVLTYFARAWPQGEGSAVHPFLPVVYYVHAAALVALSALFLRALAGAGTRSGTAEAPRYTPGATGRRAAIRTLMAAAFVVYLLNGILDARLTPPIPASPWPALHFAMGTIVAVVSPLTGWLLDRRPERLFRLVLPACCWLFILTPSLAALGYGHDLHTVLHPVTAAAQFAFALACSVSLAGLAANAGEAVFYACCVFAMRMVTVFGHVLWTRVIGAGPGTTALAAGMLAFLVSVLMRRVDFAIAGEAAPPDAGTEAAAEGTARPSGVSTGGAGGMAEAEERKRSFLASAGLTRREEEAAALLLAGASTGAIAETLGISESTAKKHVLGVFRKYGVNSRHALHARFHGAAGAEAGGGVSGRLESADSGRENIENGGAH